MIGLVAGKEGLERNYLQTQGEIGSRIAEKGSVSRGGGIEAKYNSRRQVTVGTVVVSRETGYSKMGGICTNCTE